MHIGNSYKAEQTRNLCSAEKRVRGVLHQKLKFEIVHD